jgi:hypothetical protein
VREAVGFRWPCPALELFFGHCSIPSGTPADQSAVSGELRACCNPDRHLGVDEARPQQRQRRLILGIESFADRPPSDFRALKRYRAFAAPT